MMKLYYAMYYDETVHFRMIAIDEYNVMLNAPLIFIIIAMLRTIILFAPYLN